MPAGKETIELAGFVDHVPPATPEQRAAAMRAVAARARDLDDARLLLARLGLLDPAPEPVEAPVEEPVEEPVEDRPDRGVLTEHGTLHRCPHGHLMTAENTGWVRNRSGRGNAWKWRCKACERARRRVR